jgi:CDP-diacylglycerol pyrophosphatase
MRLMRRWHSAQWTIALATMIRQMCHTAIAEPIMARSRILAAQAALLAALFTSCAVIHDDPDALWKIVSTQCVPEQRSSGRPGACTEVNLQGGYSVLKDRNGIAQYLLIPNDRIAGIESSTLLQADAPNYWSDAWMARRFVEASLHASLKPQQIGLAINAEGHRSQNQLHIHIDCMRADVTEALRRYVDNLQGGTGNAEDLLDHGCMLPPG